MEGPVEEYVVRTKPSSGGKRRLQVTNVMGLPKQTNLVPGC